MGAERGRGSRAGDRCRYVHLGAWKEILVAKPPRNAVQFLLSTEWFTLALERGDLGVF
jgi:hypothetical protein